MLEPLAPGNITILTLQMIHFRFQCPSLIGQNQVSCPGFAHALTVGVRKRGYLASWAFGEGVGAITLTKTHTMGNFSQIGGAFGCSMAKEIINGDFSL